MAWLQYPGGTIVRAELFSSAGSSLFGRADRDAAVFAASAA
jgi:hypothetical protein